jgi:hypothetical protein
VEQCDSTREIRRRVFTQPGSKADDLSVNAARPLHLTQRKNAEASLNVCVGPEAEVGNGPATRLVCQVQTARFVEAARLHAFGTKFGRYGGSVGALCAAVTC